MSNASVKNIFEKMETTNVPEDLTKAELWLQNIDLKFPTTNEEVTKTIENCMNGMNVFRKLDAKTKMLLLNKLADDVTKNSSLLCQLELKERHILIKDSKNKTVPLFIDYLKYYAQWSCTIYDQCPEYEPCGLCCIVLSPDTPLPIIGAILGAALAGGNGLVCQIDYNMHALALFLLQVFKNAGFPKDTISFIENIRTIYLYHHPLIAKYTTCLRDYSYILYPPLYFCSKQSLLHLGKTAAIIFENADQDSACDKLLDCAWSCKGMFPFGINELFVQESIFEEFVDKIKSKILKLNVAYRADSNQNKTTDILISDNANYEKEEIERINKIPLQIGYKTFGKTLSENETSDILSILPFRTASEAVTLVNNNKFGLGVSIWSDNISLCNELTKKIKASILWINTHGIISPNAAFCSVKRGDSGYFGGKEGLLEYMKPKEEYEVYTYEKHLKTIVDEKDIHTRVESAKKAYETWCKYSPATRGQCLLKLAEFSSSLKQKFPTYDYDEFWTKPLQYWSVICNNMKSIIHLQGNVELKIFKEPVGVIVNSINIVKDFETIIAALACGNAVIITNTCPELDSFFKGLSEIIPKTGIPAGLFTVIFESNFSIINSLVSHQNIEKVLYLREVSEKFDFDYKNNPHVKLREDILNAVTYNKCIWTTLGETFL